MGRKRTNVPGCGRSEPYGLSNLREQAAIRLAKKGFAGMRPADMERLVHELQVRQIELKMKPFTRAELARTVQRALGGKKDR